MNTLNVTRYMGVLLSGVALVAMASCDEGAATTEGGGGSGANDPSSTASSTGPGATSSSSGAGGAAPGLSLIDNMEDGDGSIVADAGRKGAWYTYNDKTPAGMQTPIVDMPFTMAAINPPRDGSAFGANTKGSGFTEWGSGFGFDLNNDGTAKVAYNASAYKGISFWAKIGAGTGGAVRFNIGDKNTAPEGGVCATGKCSDDFGKDLALTESWQKFDIAFGDMKQVGWSMAALPAVDAATLYYVHFQTGVNATFDIWVDDITFLQ